jgi:hypothetical protein
MQTNAIRAALEEKLDLVFGEGSVSSSSRESYSSLGGSSVSCFCGGAEAAAGHRIPPGPSKSAGVFLQGDDDEGSPDLLHFLRDQ